MDGAPAHLGVRVRRQHRQARDGGRGVFRDALEEAHPEERQRRRAAHARVRVGRRREQERLGVGPADLAQRLDGGAAHGGVRVGGGRVKGLGRGGARELGHDRLGAALRPLHEAELTEGEGRLGAPGGVAAAEGLAQDH